MMNSAEGRPGLPSLAIATVIILVFVMVILPIMAGIKIGGMTNPFSAFTMREWFMTTIIGLGSLFFIVLGFYFFGGKKLD